MLALQAAERISLGLLQRASFARLIESTGRVEEKIWSRR